MGTKLSKIENERILIKYLFTMLLLGQYGPTESHIYIYIKSLQNEKII